MIANKNECTHCDYYSQDYACCDYLSRVGHSRTVVDGVVQMHWTTCPTRTVRGILKPFKARKSEEQKRPPTQVTIRKIREERLMAHIKEIESLCYEGKSDAQIIEMLDLGVPVGTMYSFRSRHKILRVRLSCGIDNLVGLAVLHTMEGLTPDNISFMMGYHPDIIRRWIAYGGETPVEKQTKHNLMLVPYNTIIKHYMKAEKIPSYEVLAKSEGVTKSMMERISEGKAFPTAELYRKAKERWDADKR